ncbi:hypothetical protein [Polaribacter sp. R77954]|uniref:hypothetical protein n=1 Tax=Polaribacter sp. R77954 TaxID=3093870 RepID=UPI0037C9319A
MKKYIFLLFVLTNFLAHSQFGGMRNQRQRQMPQTPREAPKPNYQVEKYLGIVVYDIEKAMKKSGVKTSSDVGKQFSSTLKKYNSKIRDIRRINSFTLKSTKEMVENFQVTVQKTGDYSDKTKIDKIMVDNLKPISETLKTEDIALDKKIRSLLSDKQYKKWIKYNKKLYKIFPNPKK